MEKGKSVNKDLVFLIDDEQDNIDSIRFTIDVLGCEILEFLDAFSALEYISHMENPTSIALIICDQRMPKMTGVEFFEQIREVTPDTLRILLTGYTDTRAIVDSINKANIYRYISKPINPSELVITVKRALELFKLKYELKESDQLKRDFISLISHELITPLIGIQGGVDLIKTESSKENLQENIDLIKKSSSKMREMVESIVSFANYENGKSEIASQKVELKNAFSKLVEEYGQKAADKDLEFEFTNNAESVSLFADIDKIINITNYLLSNAVKFTNSGTISLNVDIERKRKSDHLLISVNDTGIGISEAQKSGIFELFRQVNSGYDREFGGLGIGLALVNRLLKILDGKIQLETQLDKGSSFRVDIPVVIAEKVEVIDDESNLGSDDHLVLVVDDNVVNQRILKSMLSKRGCHVQVCKNGLEAVEWCDKNICKLIFMDCQMPIMDGVEAAEEIREGKTKNKDIPIFAVTANDDDYDEDKCIKSGMNEYLIKPLKQSVVDELLDKYLK